MGRREILTQQLVLSGNGHENVGLGEELEARTLKRQSRKGSGRKTRGKKKHTTKPQNIVLN